MGYKANEAEFMKRLEQLVYFQKEITAKENRKALSEAQKRVRELDGLIKSLYESNATGKIPDKHFERLFAEYDSEQSRLEGQILELQANLEEYTKSRVRTDKFMEIIRKYQGCEEVTTPMLNEFIEKIVVHEADTSGGRTNRRQRVDIYFNFVGQIDLSEPVSTKPEREEITTKQIKVS